MCEKKPGSLSQKNENRDHKTSCKLRYGFERAGLIWLLSVHAFYLKFEKILEAPYAWRKKFSYRYEIIDDLGNKHMDTSNTGNWHVNFEK